MKKLFLLLVLVPTVLFAFWPQTTQKSDKNEKGKAPSQAATEKKPPKKFANACTGGGTPPGKPTFVPIHIKTTSGTVDPDPATLHADKDERAEFINDTAGVCGVSFDPSTPPPMSIQPGGSKRTGKVVGPCANYVYFVECAAPLKKHKDHDKDKDDSAKPAAKGDPVIIVTP